MHYKLNDQIQNSNVRLVFEDGSAELTTLNTALKLAQESAKDLIEVAVQGNISVVKIGNAYSLEKEETARKKRQKRPKIKEFKFTLAINEADSNRKVEAALNYLKTPGASIQVSLVLKGRQRSLSKQAHVKENLEQLLAKFSGRAVVVSKTASSAVLQSIV